MGASVLAGTLAASRPSSFPDIATMMDDIARADNELLLPFRTVYVYKQAWRAVERKAARRSLFYNLLKGARR
jgi:hypothetical protein